MQYDYYRFIEHLEASGFAYIGGGAYSAVYAIPSSDRVIKVNLCADGWLDYVLWAQSSGYAGTFAPRVFSYKRFDDGTYIAVVERLANTLSERYGSAVYNRNPIASATYCYRRGCEYAKLAGE